MFVLTCQLSEETNVCNFLLHRGWGDLALFVGALSVCTAFFRQTTVSFIRRKFVSAIQRLTDNKARIDSDAMRLDVNGKEFVVARREYNSVCADIRQSALECLLEDYSDEDSELWHNYRLGVLGVCVFIILGAAIDCLASICSACVLWPICRFIYIAVCRYRTEFEEYCTLIRSDTVIYNRIRQKRALQERSAVFSLAANIKTCQEDKACSRAHLIFSGRRSGLITAQSPSPAWACKNCPVSSVSTAEFKALTGDAEHPQFTHVVYDAATAALTVRPE